MEHLYYVLRTFEDINVLSENTQVLCVVLVQTKIVLENNCWFVVKYRFV